MSRGKAIGIGGIFLKFKDPTKMRQWYYEVLGLNTNDYGVLFEFNSEKRDKAYLQLGTFPMDTDYFGSDTQQAMVNFRVDDMELLQSKLKAQQVKILGDLQEYEYGKFLHIADPEGNRIELWEPIDSAFESSDDPKTVML